MNFKQKIVFRGKYMNSLLEVKYVSPKKGRGLFAKKNIQSGKTIEVANIILIPNKDYEIIQKTCIYDYIFTWDDPTQPEHMNAIAMSICQFMNHSYEPNVQYYYDYKKQTIDYIALKDIKKGEELLVNYNGLVDDKSSVWFEIE